jgi:hypothetical protein
MARACAALNRSLTAITLLLTFVMVLIVVFATLIYQFEAGDWKARLRGSHPTGRLLPQLALCLPRHHFHSHGRLRTI